MGKQSNSDQTETQADEQAAAAAAKQAEAEKAAAEQAAANKVAEAAKLAAKTGEGAPYKVAAGLSVTTLRGLVDAGGDIWPRDFQRKQDDVDDLLGRGALVRNS